MRLKDLVFHVIIRWIIETLSKQPSLIYLKASVLKSVAPSLISLMVSVDVKHHVYLRFLYHVLKSAGQPHLLPRVYMLKSVLLFP